jgi:hypothetical protein
MRMQRLIDANKCMWDVMQFVRKERTISLSQVFDEQPTAYDVDVVVDELKHKSEYIGGGYYSGRDMITLEKAIDIVKRGGIDGENN